MGKLPDNYDWRHSPGHLWCLHWFRNPNAGKFSGWEVAAKESGQFAIERFIKDGAIVVCELPELVAHKFKVPELKKILQRHGQKATGSKTELVDLALSVARDEMEEATRKLKLYKCTQLGLDVIDEHERNKAAAEVLAQNESHKQLSAGNAKEAYATFVAFRRRFSEYEYSGSPLEVERLRSIFKSAPKVIGHLEIGDWRTLQAAAAMKLLWRERNETRWLSETFATPINDNARAIRLLIANAEFRSQLANAARSCKKVKLVFEPDDVDLCEQCATLDGSVHKIDRVPELPTEHCTSSVGCICRFEDAAGQDETKSSTISVVMDTEAYDFPNDVQDDPVAVLRQLKQMLDENLIDQSEYDEKKKEIVARM
ncbi:MAG: hypothetical protein PHY43_04065 [Verrucomicrobiales bacterium]|nr:hypothetical protein [Verrucomicrobiales bacterium]